MEYKFIEDLLFICKFKDISLEKFCGVLGISFEAVSRIKNGMIKPSNEILEKFYGYLFVNHIDLNRIKIEAFKNNNHQILLFHGSKNEVVGPLDLNHSHRFLDFGSGFYLGDNYEQSLDFVSFTNEGSIYVFDMIYDDLKILDLDVSLNWMLLIALNRGKLEEYHQTSLYNQLSNMVNDYDVIIAPIADNRMFSTIDDFVNSAISSEQAIHAIKKLSLGKQIVIKSEKALKQLNLLERLYVSKEEKNAAKSKKIQEINEGESYIRNAYKEYFGKGLSISEVFK